MFFQKNVSFRSLPTSLLVLLIAFAVIALIVMGRKKRHQFDLPQRPLWAEGFLTAVGCGAVIGATVLVNSYYWPKGIVKKSQ